MFERFKTGIRVIRRLGELPGLTKKVTKRSRYPGEHDKRPGTSSDFAIRLEEKQKLRYNYGLTERQLYNCVKKARRRRGSTGVLLLQMLEMRMDNIIHRLGYTSTIPQARQLISHGHVFLNNRRAKSPSAVLKKGDKIEVTRIVISPDIIANDPQPLGLIANRRFSSDVPGGDCAFFRSITMVNRQALPVSTRVN